MKRSTSLVVRTATKIRLQGALIRGCSTLRRSTADLEKFPFRRPGSRRQLPLKPPKFARLPSVTKILSETMDVKDAAILARWKKKMVRELGEEGFAAYMTGIKSRGTALHRALEEYFSRSGALLSGLGGGLSSGPVGTEPPPADPSSSDECPVPGGDIIQGYWRSLAFVLPSVGRVYALEQTITHPALHYRGVFDCMAEFEGRIAIIDWKTAQRPKPDLGDTYDSPAQAAAYCGAYNFVAPDPLEFAVLVICYGDGSPAHVHRIQGDLLLHYWTKWLQRLKTFWDLQRCPTI